MTDGLADRLVRVQVQPNLKVGDKNRFQVRFGEIEKFGLGRLLLKSLTQTKPETKPKPVGLSVGRSVTFK